VRRSAGACRSTPTLDVMSSALSVQIQTHVETELAGYSYSAPPEGTTVGTPWSKHQVAACLERRKEKLVSPRLSLLNVLKSDRREGAPSFSDEVWVIWEEGDYLVFFDAQSELYGLAAWQSEQTAPTFWGFYGDLVYVLCAV
jgi:hypothetical protein